MPVQCSTSFSVLELLVLSVFHILDEPHARQWPCSSFTAAPSEPTRQYCVLHVQAISSALFLVEIEWHVFTKQRWISWCCRAGHKISISFQGGGVAVLYVEGLSVAAFAATISRWVSPFWSDPWNPWVPSNPRECQKSHALARMLWVQALLYFLLGILPSGPINGHGLIEDSDFRFPSYRNCCIVNSGIVWVLRCEKCLERVFLNAFRIFRAQGLAKLGSTGGSVYWLVSRLSLPSCVSCGLPDLHFPHRAVLRSWFCSSRDFGWAMLALPFGTRWLPRALSLALSALALCRWLAILRSFLWMSWIPGCKGSSIASWFSSTGGRNLQQPASSCEWIWVSSLKFVSHRRA